MAHDETPSARLDIVHTAIIILVSPYKKHSGPGDMFWSCHMADVLDISTMYCTHCIFHIDLEAFSDADHFEVVVWIPSDKQNVFSIIHNV